VGTPDYCHFGDRCFEVKCFGKYSSSYVPGSQVQLFQSPEDETAWSKYDQAAKLQAAYRRYHGYVDPIDSINDAVRDDVSDISALLDGSVDARTADGEPGHYVDETSMPAELRAGWTPWDEILSDLGKTTRSGEPSALTSYQVITQDNEYIIVLNSHLSHWQPTPMQQLPIMGNTGDPTTDPSEGACLGSQFRDEEHPCDVCLVLRQEAESGSASE
jgi:hypothetical protein